MTRRLALVTGASRGIGRATALSLARQGRDLVLCSRSGAGLGETALAVQALGVRAFALEADLSVRAQSSAVIDRATALGGTPPDIVVHVAGVAPSSKTVEASDEDWDLALELNATAAFVLARASLAHMVKQEWGRIVVVASTAGRVGYPYTAAYTASKHAAIGLVRALAVEVARFGVTVNAACPGFAETTILAEAVQNIVDRTGATEEEARRRLAGTSPQQRFIQPDEVARVVAFLTSDDAGGINGAAVHVDGGAVTS